MGPPLLGPAPPLRVVVGITVRVGARRSRVSVAPTGPAPASDPTAPRRAPKGPSVGGEEAETRGSAPASAGGSAAVADLQLRGACGADGARRRRTARGRVETRPRGSFPALTLKRAAAATAVAAVVAVDLLDVLLLLLVAAAVAQARIRRWDSHRADPGGRREEGLGGGSEGGGRGGRRPEARPGLLLGVRRGDGRPLFAPGAIKGQWAGTCGGQARSQVSAGGEAFLC